MSSYLVCGDIGGTNSRFLLYELEKGVKYPSKVLPGHKAPGNLRHSAKYQNEEWVSFDQVLRSFLNDANIGHGVHPHIACFAVAGPVNDNSASLTNRDGWKITGTDIAKAFHITKVLVINDFMAVGYGLLTIDDVLECVTIQNGVKDRNAPIACIGAGTGLGECFLTPGADGTYRCFPTEGGHADFAPRNEMEVGLVEFLKEKFAQKNRVSVERVVSGTGLFNIYEYLSTRLYPNKIVEKVHSEVMAAGDLKGAIIAKHQSCCVICKLAMDVFITAYGAEAGTAGLKWLPYGGLYLTGGLTPKNIDSIAGNNGMFLHALKDKGRVSGMLDNVPVLAVMAEDVGERGAYLVAYNEFIGSTSGSQLSSSSSSNNGCPVKWGNGSWRYEVVRHAIVGASLWCLLTAAMPTINGALAKNFRSISNLFSTTTSSFVSKKY